MVRGRSDIRNMLFFIGPQRCGKGEFTTLALGALEGFACNFDINDLLVPLIGKISNDPLDKRWLGDIILNNRRIMISNEIIESESMGINNGLSKKIASGGTDFIKFRNLYGFDVEGICNAGLMAFMNFDLTCISNMDAQNKDRSNFSVADNSFLPKENIISPHFQFEEDPLLKIRCKNKEYQRAFIGLMINHVRRRGLNGKNVIYRPPCAERNKEMIIDLIEERFKRQLEDNFEFGKDKKITIEIIKDTLKLKMSNESIGRLVMKCGFTKSLDKRYILGIGEKLDIIEETEFEQFKRILQDNFILTYNAKDLSSFKMIREKIKMESLTDVMLGKYLDDMELVSVRKNNGMFRKGVKSLE